MDKLHTDIMEDVFCRLPIETALQAKRVSITWRFLLRSKTDKVGLLFFFSYEDENKNHLWFGDQLKYNFSLDTMHNGKFVLQSRFIKRMVGSCNGLVCFRTKYPNNNFLIGNPLTGEVVYAPKHNKYPAQNRVSIDNSGFGYCPSTNVYKIVRIHSETKEKYHVQVYTVGGGEWRSKDSINFEEITNKESIQTSPLRSEGIYANGAIHWLHRRNSRPKYTVCSHDCVIAAFDLEDENFKFLPLPLLEDVQCRPHFPSPNLLGPKLLGGKNLYFVDTFYDKHCTDIWVYKRTSSKTTSGSDMRENYNDKNSWHWIKEFSIEWDVQYCPQSLKILDLLAITRNDELLVRYVRTLYCYDLKTSTWNEIFDGHAVDCNMINVIPHANSLVSLKDLEEGQDRQYPLDDSRVHGNYS